MDFTGEQLILDSSQPPRNRTEKEHLARYRFAARYVKNKRILDIACGTGYGARMLKQSGAVSAHGVDISEEAIAFAVAHCSGDGVTFSTEDAEQFTNPGAYDVIVSFETIEHVRNYLLTLKNFYAALSSGGMLILSTPNRFATAPGTSLEHTPSNPFHIREFSLSELVASLRACAFVVNEDSLFGQCDPKRFKNRFLQRVFKIFMRGSKKYSPEVRPLKDLPRLRNIVIVAYKNEYA